MMNKSRALESTIPTDTLLVVANKVIQGVAIGKKLQLVKRTVNEAQSVPQGEMILRHVEGFSGKLPNDRALKIMTNIIFTIDAPKHIRPKNIFMHTASSGPGTTKPFLLAMVMVRFCLTFVVVLGLDVLAAVF